MTVENHSSHSSENNENPNKKGAVTDSNKTDSENGPKLKKAITNHNAMKSAMALYPILESRWLWAVKSLHIYSMINVPLRLKEDIETASTKEQGVLQSQINDIDKSILFIKSRIAEIKTSLANIMAMESSNLKLWAGKWYERELQIQFEKLVALLETKDDAVLDISNSIERCTQKIASLGKP